MATPPAHSYPSPTQAQISDGSAYPYHGLPQQQQQAPQAIMSPQHVNSPRLSPPHMSPPQMSPQQQHDSRTFDTGSRSRTASQAPEMRAPREIAPHPGSFGNYQGNHEFDMQIHQQGLQQMAQQNPQQMQTGTIDGTGSPLIKRPKTSRACDQCRMKKTRCDEVPESHGTQCQSCKRTNQLCNFSREPQKRGPSKGYIKELAERVDTLETRVTQNPRLPYPTLGSGQPNIAIQTPNMGRVLSKHKGDGPATGNHGLSDVTVNYPGMPPNANSKKRSHSVSDGLHDTPTLQAQVQAFTHSHPAVAPDLLVREPILGGLHDGGGVDEVAIKIYYVKLHPFLPFLPHKWNRMSVNLANVSSRIYEAFQAALQVFAYPGKHSAIPAHQSEQRKNDEDLSTEYANVVASLHKDPVSDQTPVEKLVILQATLLMIFAVECNSPIHCGYQGWYSQAHFAASLALVHARRIRETGIVIDDLDAHLPLERRAVLTLMLMQRWNAAGASYPPTTWDSETRLVVADRILLGQAGYSALQASLVLGHTMNLAVDHEKEAAFWMAYRAEKERVVENLELALPHNPELPIFLELLYDHHASSVPPTGPFLNVPINIFTPARTAMKLLTLLSQQTTKNAFFLAHHIAAFSAQIIDTAIRKHDLTDNALGAIALFRDTLTNGGVTFPAGPMWADVLARFLTASLAGTTGKDRNKDKDKDKDKSSANGGAGAGDDATDRAGLQHLADAAVGETEKGSEFRNEVPVGYLVAVVGR